MIFAIVFFILGFILLVGGAQYLVESAVFLSNKLHIPPRIIGMTIVAFGTSMPELVVSILAANSGHQSIIFGNIIGSNIFNILFILGSTIIIFQLWYHLTQ